MAPRLTSLRFLGKFGTLLKASNPYMTQLAAIGRHTDTVAGDPFEIRDEIDLKKEVERPV